VAVALTATAERYAKDRGIGGVLAALDLDPRCAVGDLVCLLADGVEHGFVLLRRRWIVDDAETRLEITLDHPARPAR
jgi:hypothetical protein